MKVFVLLVSDYDVGLPTLSTVHSTYESAHGFLAAWCRGQWEHQGHEGPLSRSDDEAVERFFEYWDDEMEWVIEDTELDPSRADVDQSPEFATLPVDQEFFGEES